LERNEIDLVERKNTESTKNMWKEKTPKVKKNGERKNP
jgi:hypothetical protein